jgi:hypothetical protein
MLFFIGFLLLGKSEIVRTIERHLFDLKQFATMIDDTVLRTNINQS